MTHSDPQIERALLGSFLQDADAFYSCATLTRDDFSLDSNRRIFSVISAMYGDNRQPDIVTLCEELQKSAQLHAVGGAAYIADITSGVLRRKNHDEYIQILKEKTRLRKLQSLADRIATAANSPGASSSEIAATWDSSISGILDGDEQDKPLVKDFLVDTLNRIEHESQRPAGLVGISYGIPGLDRMTSGMMPGEVTAIGARSGVGKSSAMIQAAAANCKLQVPVHLFSLEMTRDRILRRLISIVSGVYYFRLRDPRQLGYLDKKKMHIAAEEIAEWPLRIHDKSEMDITQIVRLAKLSIRQHNTRLIGVDYAQIVSGEGRDDRTRVSAVSRQLTAAVKHENCSLMLLSQLVKGKREYYNTEPTIGDLGETGQIENDAHTILLLHRGWGEEPGPDGKPTERILSSGKILIPKQREGDTGVIDVGFDRNFVVFTDREQ